MTSRLSSLLNLPDREAAGLYQNASLFDRYIHKIMETPIDGETEIYKIGNSKYIRILMPKSQEGYLGIITDVTQDVVQKQAMLYRR